MGVFKKFSAVGGAAVSAVSAAGVLGAVSVPASANAASALPVSFSVGNGGTVHYNWNGDIVVNDVNGNGTARVFVNLARLGDTSVPQTPPSFTADNATRSNPWWDIVLSDGTTTKTLFGFPVQADGTANDSFTGDQWFDGTSRVTYQQALGEACPTLSACHVKYALIDDGSTTPITLSNVQYDGETAAPGVPLAVSPVPDQTLTAVHASTPVKVHATTTTAPGTLTYSDNGTLPPGLTINPTTGVIGGAPVADAVGSGSATITVTDAAGDTDATQIAYTVKAAPASGMCSASTGCAWQRLTNPSSMAMDVKGQTPHSGSPIIAYTPKVGDPAVDFTAVISPAGASSEQLTYTPYGTQGTAQARNPALAAAAYNADGSAKYCVSSVADTPGQALQLRPCATITNEWQDFIHAGDAAGGSMIEPTYGSAGESAGSDPMAINDKAYGGNGTPLINYAATGSGNELFTPGI